MSTSETANLYKLLLQFEAYNLEKLGKNSKEAAKLLEGLYVIFTIYSLCREVVAKRIILQTVEVIFLSDIAFYIYR